MRSQNRSKSMAFATVLFTVCTTAVALSGSAPAFAAVPAGCMTPTDLQPGDTWAMCAETPTESGLPIPPREESPPSSPIGRGPTFPDPDPSAPDPVPLEDFTEPTPEPAQPQQLPANVCDDRQFSEDRFVTCQYRELGTRIFNPDTGVTTGTGAHDVATKITRDPKKREWKVEFKVKTVLSTGTGSSGTFRARISIHTCENCTVAPGGDTATKDIPVNTAVIYNFTIRAATTSKVFARHRARITISHPTAAPGKSVDIELGAGRFARCDSEPYISGQGGCVYPLFIPTFKLPLSNPDWNEVSAHILNSQLVKPQHWGLKDQGPPLSRITDKAWMRQNRRLACFGVVTTPGVTSCDEYPFASTRQGAAFQGIDNTTRAVVSQTDNERAGSHLSKFYSDNRILSGDRFWVDAL